MVQSQPYVFWYETQKISATVKNISEKLAKELPCGSALHLNSADYAMVRSRHLHPLGTAEVELLFRCVVSLRMLRCRERVWILTNIPPSAEGSLEESEPDNSGEGCEPEETES